MSDTSFNPFIGIPQQVVDQIRDLEQRNAELAAKLKFFESQNVPDDFLETRVCGDCKDWWSYPKILGDVPICDNCCRKRNAKLVELLRKIDRNGSYYPPSDWTPEIRSGLDEVLRGEIAKAVEK